MEYTREDLEQAQKSLSSSIGKIEKAKDTLSKRQPIPKSQLTLATRNLAALRLSLFLIKQELEKHQS